MDAFQWTGEMNVFQPEFDAEHRELLRLCGELHRSIQAEADSAAVQDVLRQLATEVEAHFTHEERSMRAKRYSGYAWHKRQHDNARRKLKALAETSPGEVPAFMVEWMQGHTGVADRMMAASLRNAGRFFAGGSCHVLTATKKVRPSPKLPDMPRSSAS